MVFKRSSARRRPHDLEDEEIPLGPPGLSGSYEAGYGITWTRGSEGDDLTRFTNNDQTAKIVLIGNTDESVQLAGLTRDEAEAILGSPITRYNSIRIPVITGTSKEYYKLDGDLVILYFDGNANETVLFSAQMDRSMASDTKVFTSSNIEPYSPRDFEAMTIELLNAIRVSYGKTTHTQYGSSNGVPKSQSIHGRQKLFRSYQLRGSYS